MTTLNRKEVDEFDHLAASLRKASEDVEAAQAKYNEAMVEAFAPVAQAVADYNEAIAAARDYAEQKASDFRSEYEGRSEKWQESDKGSSLDSLASEWENISLDELEADQPDPLDLLSDDTSPDDFQGLPTESDS